MRLQGGADGMQGRIERTAQDGSRVLGRYGAGRPPRREGPAAPEMVERRHQVILGGGRRRKLGRQRRVGETSWTDAMINTVESTIQAATLRGQNVSRRIPNCCTGA